MHLRKILATYSYWLTLALVVLFAFAITAEAANQATITFTAPSKRTDGSSITGALSYEVWQGLKGQAKTKIGTITATNTTVTAGLLGGNEYCWHVVAIEAGNPKPSDPPSDGCKAFELAAPETVTITVE